MTRTQQRRTPVGADLSATLVARLQQSPLFHDYRAAFEEATGLPLVLREAGSFRTPLQGSRNLNPFCAQMMQTSNTCASCLQLQQRLETAAVLAPATLRCHSGLSETAVPVRVGDRVIGYLQTGQVFLRVPTMGDFTRGPRRAFRAANGTAAPALKTAYFQTRVVSRKHYASIVRLLAVFAEHLAAISNQMLVSEEAGEAPVITRARQFIAAHQGEDLCLGDAARAVNMNVCYFCKVFHRGTGLVFTEYLARARVETVKRMLLNAHTRVSEACYAAGFQSLSQFNRVFARVAGETPSGYRERVHGIPCLPRRRNVLAPAA